MEQLLKLYLRRLTNLTGNNRSILLKRLIADHFIDLHELNFLYEHQSSFNLIEQLIAKKQEIFLSPLADSRDSAVNIASRKLKKLQRTNRFILEERGSQDLYVGWPFVRGQFADGTLIHCPLLFFPVNITEDGRNWKLDLRQDVSISLNKSFLLAYAHFNELKLPEKLYEKAFDDWDKDSRVFRTNLYKLFREEEPLEINFNQEVFIDSLITFQELKSSELKEQTKAGELKLFPEAVLGIFPQAGSFIVPDYNSLLEDSELKSMEDLFVSRRQRRAGEQLPEQSNTPADSVGEELRQIREEAIFAPFPMDASQEKAIRAIKSGRSLVVQGPPGTGKSQLIANVMADSMAKGKRVLLVSQKKAALDVVHKRLDQKQILGFVALVHDFKWDRSKIYEQILRQIDRVPEYKASNYSLDSIQLERKFLQASRRIEQITEELEEFKFALFDDSECGVSIKDLYLSSSRNGPMVDLKQEYKHYRVSEVEPFLRKLKTFLRLGARLNTPSYPWQDRLSFAKWGVTDQQKIAEVIKEVNPFQFAITGKLKEILQNDISFETATYLLSRKDRVEELLEILKEPDVYESFRHMTSFKQGTAEPEELNQLERSLMQCYSGEGPELNLPTSELGSFQEVLQNRMAARRNAIKWISWKYFNKEDNRVRRVMILNKLKDSSGDMAILEQKIDNRLNLEHNLSKLREATWLLNVPENYQKLEFQQWFIVQKKALAALDLYCQVRGLGQYLNVRKLSYTEFSKSIEAVYHVLAEIPRARERWMTYLTPLHIDQLFHSESFARLLIDTLDEDFDLMVEFDRMKENLGEEEHKLLQKLSAAGVGGEEAVAELFMNSLRLAWINHIEAKYPVLRSVTTLSFQQLEDELRHCVEEKAATSQEMLLMKVREQTYQQLEYNRLNNLVTYRDLRHQVSKKKKIWPIRKLLDQFSEELFQLVPCWMASPEAVSAIFPLEEMFDLVIFDEASQCFVEKGIPAMYRGKQIVVTGDSKQLQPNDLYQVRWEEDEPEELAADLEVGSLLDLAQRYLMQIQLKGHYRSRAPELIAFSNQHFYGGNLQLIPELEVTNSKDPAIHFEKVEGVWEDQANPREAAKVVELVMNLYKTEKQKYLDSGQDGVPWYEQKSIGVVTFNARQQSLIQDLLEEQSAREEILLPGDLFVKNIENVQGDERDIIVFSIGYAPDQEGRMSMQFGSLNAAQGENRLNVAVTRARYQIYVVSSIRADQLKTGESRNEGPRLFKAYLQYAQDVSEGRYQPEPFQSRQDTFVNYLKNRLKEMTSEPHYQLKESQPFADLTVLKEGVNKGVLFTDDAQYFSVRSLKEIHVYRKQELENKGWSHSFIFSREYWRNPEKLRERLNRFIHHL